MRKPEFTCSVVVRHLAEQSKPEDRVYAFAYTVTIRNSGRVPGQLIGRHWIITDANGHTEEVRGLGVVGKQPLLQPGEQFEYTSWTRLRTPLGTMHGRYFCMTDEAESFEVPIDEFGLTLASALH